MLQSLVNQHELLTIVPEPEQQPIPNQVVRMAEFLLTEPAAATHAKLPRITSRGFSLR